jgi:hypothetical protein
MFEFAGATMRATLDLARGQQRKEALDQIEPGGRGRCEVHLKARMARKPSLGIKDSAYRLDHVARYALEKRLFETYYAAASVATKACQANRADPSCAAAVTGNEEDMFCQPFMRCLSEVGREAGKAAAGEDKWTRELMTKTLGSRP